MSYTAIRDDIVTGIETVTNVGTVYNYWPFVTDTNSFVDTFVQLISGEQEVRAWMVRFASAPARVDESPFAKLTYQYAYQVHGYQAIGDAGQTERRFLELAESVVLALAQRQIMGTANAVVHSQSVDLTDHDVRQLGDVVCHHVQIDVNLIVDVATY